MWKAHKTQSTDLFLFVCQLAGLYCRESHPEATGAALCCLGKRTPHSSPWLPHSDEWWQPQQPHELHRQSSGKWLCCHHFALYIPAGLIIFKNSLSAVKLSEWALFRATYNMVTKLRMKLHLRVSPCCCEPFFYKNFISSVVSMFNWAVWFLHMFFDVASRRICIYRQRPFVSSTVPCSHRIELLNKEVLISVTHKHKHR